MERDKCQDEIHISRNNAVWKIQDLTYFVMRRDDNCSGDLNPFEFGRANNAQGIRVFISKNIK